MGKDKKTKKDLELPLADNQFTANELLVYMDRVYGSKVAQTKFTNNDLFLWFQLGKIPEAYGGNRIDLSIMSGVGIYEVEGLTREDLRYVRTIPAPIHKRPDRKHKDAPRRTKLYYKITGKVEPANILPDNWRQLGIRGNQLQRVRKS